MRAARLHHYDPDLAGPEFLRIEEVPPPEIREPDDVLVRIGAAGVCRTDLHIIQGLWQHAAVSELPYTLGHENAGWVEDHGSGVRSVEAGDAVVLMPGVGDGTCPACRTGRDNQCQSLVWQGIQTDGGFTEFVVTKARNLVRIPPELTPAQAAPYVDAGLTAYHACKRALQDLSPGDVAVIIGVGGLGHVAVQLLHELSGAEVVAVDIDEEGRRLAAELGADLVLDSLEAAEREIPERTGGVGARAVLDFVSEGDVPDRAFGLLGVGGHYFVVGYGGTLTVPTMDIMGTERRITGNVGGTHDELRELFQLASRGRVALRVREYPFDEVNRALADLAAGGMGARGVVVP